MSIKVAAIGDSAKLDTGFGTVMKPILMGFHEHGFEVHSFGLLDHEKDEAKELPYIFYPVPFLDDLGHETYVVFLRSVKPDLIFILTDPGNLNAYMHGLAERKQVVFKRGEEDYIPPVLAYMPIEGYPGPRSHGEAMAWVEQLGGKNVVYCQSAYDMVKRQFPDVEPAIINHGLDHFSGRLYAEKDRQILRELVGFKGKFVIGSVGVNKRTKGLDTIIYTAAELRKAGLDEDILFYLHTDPDRRTMEGYWLREMAKEYDVADMVLFKPKIDENYWKGISRRSGTLEQARQLAGKVPESPEGRGLLWATYDFESMLNCLDLYLDLSQIEGWGLPIGEAMACGVPCLSVHDHHVRDEIYSEAAVMIDALPRRMWGTWHSNMRLVAVDPKMAAEKIVELKLNPEMLASLSEKGTALASKYKWQPSVAKMIELAEEILEADKTNIVQL